MTMLIDIGIAVNKNQSKRWWPEVWAQTLRIHEQGRIRIGNIITVGSAMDEFSKNTAAALGLKRMTKTDLNRGEITRQFLDDRADAIWWIDDDTVPPADALTKLVDLETDIAAGIYVLRVPPCNPIAYMRLSNGGYTPLWNFERGQIVHVDSVGMGCTLVRRHVYEKILNEYLLFQRVPTGTYKAVHREDFEATEYFPDEMHAYAGRTVIDYEGVVYHIEQMKGPVDSSGVARWPFYAMEYGRTEDHHFCEMVKRCGFDIVVDTSIDCKHWGERPITLDTFFDVKAHVDAQEGAGDASP